jgi:hypothetical protein
MSTTGFDSSKLQDRSWKGEGVKFDKKIAKKPADKDRRCTDAFCCIVFALFFGCMLALTTYGYIYGSPGKLIAPIAPDGTICGYDKREGYPYLYIQDITSASAKGADIFAYGVCVKECPTSKTSTLECSPACDPQYPVYPTWYLFDYCATTYDDLPPSAQANWDNIMNTFQNSYYGSGIMDIYKATWPILLSPIFGILFTFGYIYFMDKCAYWLAWISVALLQLILIGSGIGCYMYRQDLIEGMTDEQISNSSLAYTLNWATWLCWIAAAIYYLLVICMFKSLKIAIAVIETAADYFADTKRVIFVPVLFFFVGIVIFCGWCGSIICVASIGEIKVEDALS